MANEKWKNRADDLQQQLKTLAERIPDIRWVGLIHTSGLRLGYYNKSHDAHPQQNDRHGLPEQEHEEADRVSPISAALMSLSERISAPAGLGQWNFSVIAGNRAKIVALVLNEEAVLVAIVEPSASIEAIQTELKSSGERLVAF